MRDDKKFQHKLPPCGVRFCRTQNLVHYEDEPGARIHCAQCRTHFVKDGKVGWRKEGRRDA